MPAILMTLLVPIAAASAALRTGRGWFKLAVPGTSAVILVVSASVGRSWSLSLGAIVAAFVFSAAGDFFLSNKGSDTALFVRGIALYALAHVGYLLAALFNAGISVWLFAVLVAALSVYFFAFLAPAIKERPLAISVFGYIVLSCAAMAASVTVVWPTPSPLLYATGIALILFSDLMISLYEFRRVVAARPLILPTYYAAHLLITASVLLLSA